MAFTTACHPECRLQAAAEGSSGRRQPKRGQDKEHPFGDSPLASGGDGDFWLLPGETREATIECATSDLHGQPAAVKVSGYRVPGVTTGAL